MSHPSCRFGGVLLATVVVTSPAPAQLTFNFTNQGSATPQMMAGFAEAGALWSARIQDPMTVNIRINAAALPSGQIAGTSSFFDPYAYSDVRNALLADRKSADDFSAAGHLQSGPVISMLLNRTANHPGGAVNPAPYFDTGLGGPGQAGPENNNTIRVTSANAKALGLIPGSSAGLDGTITFSTAQAYDFHRADGIAANQIDFVGAAAHEIGHLLGFISGVDNLDRNGAAPGLNDNQLKFVTPLDLHRFSSRSVGVGGGVGVIDWTADGTDKYFSIDGGTTALGSFATGANFGDGHEPHHWKNGQGLGIMDPTAANGELLAITANDLRVFDVIGYDLTPVPEPSTCLLIAFAGYGGLRSVSHRRRIRSARCG